MLARPDRLIFEDAFFKTCQKTKSFFCKTLQHKLYEEPQGDEQLLSPQKH